MISVHFSRASCSLEFPEFRIEFPRRKIKRKPDVLAIVLIAGLTLRVTKARIKVESLLRPGTLI